MLKGGGCLGATTPRQRIIGDCRLLGEGELARPRDKLQYSVVKQDSAGCIYIDLAYTYTHTCVYYLTLINKEKGATNLRVSLGIRGV